MDDAEVVHEVLEMVQLKIASAGGAEGFAGTAGLGARCRRAGNTGA